MDVCTVVAGSLAGFVLLLLAADAAMVLIALRGAEQQHRAEIVDALVDARMLSPIGRWWIRRRRAYQR